MPRAWSDKDERQYEHVLESEKARDPERAEEIAARTVNKQRRKEGRTRQQQESVAGETREQLYAEARKLGIRGRSRMNKAQLARAVGRTR